MSTMIIPSKIYLPERFAGWSEEELRIKLRAKQYNFACEFINNGYDAIKAWLYVYYGVVDGVPVDKITRNKARTASDTALNNSCLVAYLYTVIKRTANSSATKNQHTFDSWFNDLIKLRDKAAKAEQFAAAIQAHKMLGAANALLTPHERQNTANKSSQSLIERLQVLNPSAALALAPHLGINAGTDIIDAEVIEPSATNIDDLL